MSASVTTVRHGSIPHNNNYSPSQNLLEELQKGIKQRNQQLVVLFDQLGSDNAQTVRKAEEEIQYLEDHGISFHTIALASFPLWPIDASALRKMALDQSGSTHPLLRKRAQHACSYLITNGYKEGYEVATILSSANMRSEDETIQEEGFDYFVLLLEQWRPKLHNEDLVLAISMAKKFSMTNQHVRASAFFEKLVKHGTEADVALLKNIAEDLIASKDLNAFFIGDQLLALIINNRSNYLELFAISLQGAISMCASDDPYRRNQGLDLFWSLLRWNPELTIDPLLQALEIESKRKDPQTRILGRLNELAGHDFSNLFHAKEAVLQRAQENAPALLRILTNLSLCHSPYIQQQAVALKQVVEDRIKKNE